MEIQVRAHKDWKVLSLTGKLVGREAARLKQFCQETVEENQVHVVVDFENLEFVDSTGLGALIHCHQVFTGKQGQLVLMNISDMIYDLLEMTSIDKLFHIIDSEEELRELS